MIVGDVGEVTLFQGPVNPSIRVGGSGGWNNTQAPRWFFLSQATNNEMTDAEIRGGLDGLILASEMQRLRQRAPSMRLSQLLEMYYSQVSHTTFCFHPYCFLFTYIILQ